MAKKDIENSKEKIREINEKGDKTREVGKDYDADRQEYERLYKEIEGSDLPNKDKIEKLKELNLPITLSVSLHAPNDQIRNTMMPVNKKWNVEALLKACKDYQKVTTRRISFEYALISGVNDSKANAMELAKKLSGIMCHINLIPANPVKENSFQKPDRKNILLFKSYLEAMGMTVTVRRTLGADISASCGQLRKKAKEGGQIADIQ